MVNEEPISFIPINGPDTNVGALQRQLGAKALAIREHETQIISESIALGQLADQLKDYMSKATWSEMMQRAGFTSSIARCLQRIGASTLARETGTLGSGLLAQLPTDPQKLVWLLKLAPAQLDQFARTRNLKLMSRQRISQDVQTALGISPPTRQISHLLRAWLKVQELHDWLMRTIPDMGPDLAYDPINLPNFRRLFEENYQQVQQALRRVETTLAKGNR